MYLYPVLSIEEKGKKIVGFITKQPPILFSLSSPKRTTCKRHKGANISIPLFFIAKKKGEYQCFNPYEQILSLSLQPSTQDESLPIPQAARGKKRKRKRKQTKETRILDKKRKSQPLSFPNVLLFFISSLFLFLLSPRFSSS